MLSCFPVKRFQRRRQPQLDPREDPTVPISVYGKTTSKIAMLWTPEDNWDTNLLSAETVKRLGVQIDLSEKDMSSVDFMGQEIETKGHVLLKWGVERSGQVHRTRFLVATAQDPSFEIVLGRRHAVEYGLVQS